MKALVFFLSLFLGVFGAVQASEKPHKTQPAAKIPNKTDSPNIKILADQMDCSQDQKKCIARGNASAQKLNEPQERSVRATELHAFFTKDAQGKTKIQRLEAHQSVLIHHDNTIATCNQAEYTPETEIVKMFGQVRITQDKNQIEGEEGTINLQTGAYRITRSSGKQVQALVFSSEKK